MSEFIAVLGAVTIDSDNDTIELDEGGSVAAATIAHGTYFCRGDGSTIDLLRVIEDALDAAFVGGNTYGVTLTTDGTTPSLCISAASPSATVRIARATGSTSFRVRWNHASATFDPAVLGFAVEKTAVSASAETSTLSPSCIWVHNDRHIDLISGASWVTAQEELADGHLSLTKRSATAHSKRLLLEMVDGRRMWIHRTSTDPARSWLAFVALHNDGRPLQLHELDLQSGSSTLLAAPTRTTRVVVDDVSQWMLAGESAEELRAERVRTGMDHWDLEVLFRGIVPDEEEEVAPPSAPSIWFDSTDIDGTDNNTLTVGVSTLSSWVNKGTAGGTATQATSGSRPLLTADGVQFAHGSPADFMDFSATLTQPFAMLAVVKPTATTSTVASGGASSKELSCGSSQWYIASTTGLFGVSGTNLSLFNAVAAIFNGASSSLRRNDDAAAAVSGNAGSTGWSTLRIGADSAGGFGLTGTLKELVVWTGSSLPTTAQMLAYAEEKFGAFPQ